MKGKPFKKIFGVLKSVAPTAVAALGGPYGALAAGVMKKVMGDESMSDDELEGAVLAAAASPDDVVKLKEIDAKLIEMETTLGLKFEELAVADRASARSLAIQTNFWPQVALSVIFVVGYFLILAMFFSGQEMIPMSDAFMVMLGVLTGGVPQVLGFWLGSSSGSQGKTEALTAAMVSRDK